MTEQLDQSGARLRAVGESSDRIESASVHPGEGVSPQADTVPDSVEAPQYGRDRSRHGHADDLAQGRPHGRSHGQRYRGWRQAAIPFLVLVACAAGAILLLETGPVAERQVRPREARLVSVSPVSTSAETAVIHAMGTVVPTRSVVLQAQVSGRVIEVAPDFVPGGRFEPGDVMLRIEPADYELAVRQRESELHQAQAELAMERGNQSVALLEFELLGDAVSEADRNLVLRGPQLKTVEARVEAAEAALARARLDLDRTVLRAPFPALVRERGAELGARLDPTTAVATLVDTQAYWVEVLVPVSDLQWIELPGPGGQEGSRVSLIVGRAATESAGSRAQRREGRVVRLLGDLESEGRMARLLVQIEDPLGAAEAGDAPLLLGSFVTVEIVGRRFENVVALDRSLLRDGDRVWLLSEDGSLEIRPVEAGFRGAERVFVTAGLAAGERIVVTDLSTPVAGMPLRIEGAARSDGASGV